MEGGQAWLASDRFDIIAAGPAIAAGRVKGERCGGTIMPGHVEARGMTMALVTSGLARLMPNVGRPVVDRTGLAAASTST